MSLIRCALYTDDIVDVDVVQNTVLNVLSGISHCQTAEVQAVLSAKS